tara:strand:+ start:400 stop:1005 length:606 start_codon:yes stop_codon:yes gene_type:complete
MMYIKFLLGQLKVLLMIIFSGLFVYPFIVYPKRKYLWDIRGNRKESQPWYFWYADTYESGFGSDIKNYKNSMYGLYELLRNNNGDPDYSKFFTYNKFQKFILSYRWAVLRNGVWNYIINNSAEQGEKTDVVVIANTGDKGFWTWRNKSYFGKQHVTWTMNGQRYFRYSFTKVMFAGICVNFMLGTGGSAGRDVIKLRFFKI